MTFVNYKATSNYSDIPEKFLKLSAISLSSYPPEYVNKYMAPEPQPADIFARGPKDCNLLYLTTIHVFL